MPGKRDPHRMVSPTPPSQLIQPALSARAMMLERLRLWANRASAKTLEPPLERSLALQSQLWQASSGLHLGPMKRSRRARGRMQILA